MRFVTNLNKGMLGSADSTELWTEIISHISDEVLLKPDIKILNVACGHLTEARLLVARMRALGKTAQEANDAIVVLDKYSEFTNAAKMMGFKNVVKSDFMEWETDMKFDLVLTNPPYQDSEKKNNATSLWIPILEKCTQLSDQVVAVTPINWLNVDMSKYVFLKDRQITKAKIYEKDTTPFPGIGIRVGYMIIDGENRNEDTVFIDSHTNEEINVNLGTCGNLPGTINTLALSIWNKTMTKKKKMGFNRKGQVHTQRQNLWSHTKSKTFKYPLYRSDEYVWSSVKKDNFNDTRVIIPEARSHKKAKVITKGNTSQSVYYTRADTKEQAENLRQVVCSRLFTFLIEVSKWGPALSQSTLENLPAVDANVSYSDQDLYKLFKLTKKEIEYIESNTQ